jgi:hypothetical protein
MDIITGQAGIASASMRELSWRPASPVMPQPLAAAVTLRVRTRFDLEVGTYLVQDKTVFHGDQTANFGDICKWDIADTKFSTRLGARSASPPV